MTRPCRDCSAPIPWRPRRVRCVGCWLEWRDAQLWRTRNALERCDTIHTLPEHMQRGRAA